MSPPPRPSSPCSSWSAPRRPRPARRLPGDFLLDGPARRHAARAGHRPSRCRGPPTTSCSRRCRSLARPEARQVDGPLHRHRPRRRFEANVQWELMQGDTVVKQGFTQPRSAARWRRTPSRSRPRPARYTLVVHDEDASGGRGPGRDEGHQGDHRQVDGTTMRRSRLTSGMTTIGLIGAGNIGQAVARLAVDHGYDVVLSNSRGPETPRPTVVDRARHRARRPTRRRALTTRGDIVVVTVPLKAYQDVPVEPLAGKVVIDTNNYYPERDGRIAGLDEQDHDVGRAAPGAPAGLEGRQGLQPHPVRAPHRARLPRRDGRPPGARRRR